MDHKIFGLQPIADKESYTITALFLFGRLKIKQGCNA